MYNYKFFLSVVAFLGLLQQLLSLVQLGIHQLLLQIFVLHHFVYVLVGGSQGQRNTNACYTSCKNVVN